MRSRRVDASRAAALAVVAAAAVVTASTRIAAQQSPRLVQGKVYVFAPADTNGVNVVVQSGADGVLLVDTQPVDTAQRVFAAVRSLSSEPIRWIVNTSGRVDHMGGNDALTRLGTTPASVGRTRVVAHQNVVHRLVGNASVSRDAWPNDDFFTPDKDFFFNGEAIVVTHMPAATTDGDSIVFFRRSDVIATGDVFTPGKYPAIDLAAGGSVQGEINALNVILHIAVPGKYQEGGTYIVPGHGRICDEADLVEYRDMLTVVRDRVQDLIKKGSTLDQVKAARPSRDYDPEYTRSGGPSADAFVEVVYRSLTKR
jgi:cyclase